MKKVGLFYGSDGGVTQEVAQKVADKLGDCQMFDVASCSAEDIAGFDNLILATPTYGSGDLQDDWDSFLSSLDESAFSGKTIALLGLGDQDIYSDTFCNGIAHIYKKVSKQGKIVGQTSTDGYTFDDSEAVVDGKFVGLVIDEVNQEENTEQRIAAWIDSLKNAFA
ncbi:flavodoxin FldA [Helicobacter cinaedi PAGU611]|uniref:Flavodoxin n=1 Tax=Helicobacter cinaedi CCUG 18818 = ATCC BAA-847 TaxID=537971 RepID=A0AAI8MQU1_9HELI|nr:flavodoxin [Helicobacter cinaedi]AWK62463.1 flavodoxin [Helicobacter cinaedi]EFR46003.1 flavodoxin [Helicobacter cinaedi CCUG 18818 = ATCC BAA-847]QOQ90741.1 flavodoxin [Helicobacter cinaedi]QOQ96901.1 flavodoxin [Helicobacter cinaedi]BAM13027.1 flavodoxin FldA [Helicobacter cinaedi PAGU611]